MITNMNEIKKNEDLNIRKIGEQYYLIFKHDCYEVNIVGAIIVKNLGENINIDDFCNKISLKFDFKNFKQIKSDFFEFLFFLKENGLINYE